MPNAIELAQIILASRTVQTRYLLDLPEGDLQEIYNNVLQLRYILDDRLFWIEKYGELGIPEGLVPPDNDFTTQIQTLENIIEDGETARSLINGAIPGAVITTIYPRSNESGLYYVPEIDMEEYHREFDILLGSDDNMRKVETQMLKLINKRYNNYEALYIYNQLRAVLNKSSTIRIILSLDKAYGKEKSYIISLDSLFFVLRNAIAIGDEQGLVLG